MGDSRARRGHGQVEIPRARDDRGRLVDVDNDGKAEILADRSSEGTDVRKYGDYVIQHPSGAVLLKGRNDKLDKLWKGKTAYACASRR